MPPCFVSIYDGIIPRLPRNFKRFSTQNHGKIRNRICRAFSPGVLRKLQKVPPHFDNRAEVTEVPPHFDNRAEVTEVPPYYTEEKTRRYAVGRTTFFCPQLRIFCMPGPCRILRRGFLSSLHNPARRTDSLPRAAPYNQDFIFRSIGILFRPIFYLFSSAGVVSAGFSSFFST